MVYREKIHEKNAPINCVTLELIFRREHLKLSLSDTVCVSADEGLNRREEGGWGGKLGICDAENGLQTCPLRLCRVYLLCDYTVSVSLALKSPS